LRNGKVNWKVAKILFLDEISMFDIKDFLKLDKYLRHFMAQYNPEAMNFPFGGLNIVLCGDFSQLNPIGQSVIYDRNANALWNLINRVVILNFKNHQFATDPERHPKEDQDFNVPQETIIIKGNFLNMKTDESKSAAYHKMVQSKCGDDNVQCGNGQSII